MTSPVSADNPANVVLAKAIRARYNWGFDVGLSLSFGKDI